MSSAQKRQPKFTSPQFKAGDYVPLAILIMEGNGKVVNYHLPQKLFALKDFKQDEMMQHYFYQHPQQPVYLDQNRPDIGAFNSSIINLHKWLILNGYARQEGAANLTVHIWTEEEMAVAREEIKAAQQARQLAHAEAMAAGGDDMLISQGVNNLLGAANDLSELGTKLYAEGSLGKEEHTPVNVGTIGHIDHGVSGVSRALERVDPAAPIEAGIPESYLTVQHDGKQATITLDPADPDPADTAEYLEQKLGQLGIAGNNISYAPAAVESAVAEMQERAPDDLELMYPTDVELIQAPAARTPQYPAIDAPADLVEPQSVKGE